MKTSEKIQDYMKKIILCLALLFILDNVQANNMYVRSDLTACVQVTIGEMRCREVKTGKIVIIRTI